MRAYSDPRRETDPYSLPDVEVFYRTRKENKADGVIDSDGEPMGTGWYWWTCFPGCMPDSDPFGPYETEAEALAAAQEDALESAGWEDNSDTDGEV